MSTKTKKTLGQRVDALMERYNRERRLQAEEGQYGNPYVFAKPCQDLQTAIEHILTKYEF